VGVVEEIGSAVTGVKVGQRVHFYKLGTWRDLIVVDTSSDTLVPIPDTVSDFEGAQLTINPLTVVAMVSDLKIKEGSGEFLLQSASASALGRFVIQYAKAKGFKTINIVRRSEQVEELKKLGADYVINSDTEDLVAKVNEITQGEGVKYAIDPVGGAIGSLIVKTLSKKGQYLAFGRLASEPLELDMGFLVNKGVSVTGFWLIEWIARPEGKEERTKAGYGEIIRLLESKQVTLASEPFPAKDFKDALEHCKKPGKSEKTLLLFNQK